jgi:hypothetical protein
MHSRELMPPFVHALCIAQDLTASAKHLARSEPQATTHNCNTRRLRLGSGTSRCGRADPPWMVLATDNRLPPSNKRAFARLAGETLAGRLRGCARTLHRKPDCVSASPFLDRPALAHLTSTRSENEVST